ncbi:hypothetical protein [Gluconacetobacter entanii]|uniref:hypothetical protein n=1 Tax=Gluconacetobacter entanii TaxID=108528 RepID=UPI0011B6302E|nr:hypothetical protein [Gluconacetobacter entanii]
MKNIILIISIIYIPSISYAATCQVEHTEQVLTKAMQQNIHFDNVSRGHYQTMPVCQGNTTVYGVSSIITWMNNGDGSVTVVNNDGSTNKYMSNGDDSAMGSTYKKIFGGEANRQAQLLQQEMNSANNNDGNTDLSKESFDRKAQQQQEIVDTWNKYKSKCEKLLNPNAATSFFGSLVGDDAVRNPRKLEACRGMKRMYDNVVSEK